MVGSGEGIDLPTADFLQRSSKVFTQSLDRLGDARNVIALRNGERDRHLPQVLSENADASTGLERIFEEWVILHLGFESFVVRVQIKVWNPDCLKFLSAAPKDVDITTAMNINGVVTRDCDEFVGGILPQPEALPRICDLP